MSCRSMLVGGVRQEWMEKQGAEQPIEVCNARHLRYASRLCRSVADGVMGDQGGRGSRTAFQDGGPKACQTLLAAV